MFKQIFILLILSFAAFSKPLVLVSVPPYKTMVEKIGQNDVEVISIAPPSSDPHTFEPTAKQMQATANAKIWFQIGESFEKKLDPLISAKKVDLRHGIALLRENHHHHHCHACGAEDKHIWLSPKQMAIQVDRIEQELSHLIPEKKEIFQKRKNQLVQELILTDQKLHDRLDPIKHRSFVVSHPAFGYFCHDFDLKQLSVEMEGKDPRPKDLEALLKEAKKTSAKIAIAMPQHNNRGTELVAKKLDLTLHQIDPYSADYFETLEKLSTALHDSN